MSCDSVLFVLSESQRFCSANRIGTTSTASLVVSRCPASQIRYRTSLCGSAERVRRTLVCAPHCGHRNAAAFTFGTSAPPDVRCDVRCKRLPTFPQSRHRIACTLAADPLAIASGVLSLSTSIGSQDIALRFRRGLDQGFSCQSVQFKEGGHSPELGPLDHKTQFHRIKHWQFKRAKGRGPNVLGPLESHDSAASIRP